MAGLSRAIRALARMYGVQVSYVDAAGLRRHATAEGVRRILELLGAPLPSVEKAASAVRERRQSDWRDVLPRVAVAWTRRTSAVELRLPSGLTSTTLRARLDIDSAEPREWSIVPSELTLKGREEIEGSEYVALKLPLPGDLPAGYHHLVLRGDSWFAECLVIAAPRHAWHVPPRESKTTWGVFLPIYALRSERNWGGGDFTDLESLVEWTADLGGEVVATLPLLAAFLDEPFNASPYSPASRLFWNEVFLDPKKAPEFERSERAREIAASAEFRATIDELRAEPLVDYGKAMAVKRSVLTEMAQTMLAGSGERRAAFQLDLDAHPRLADYAAFRAVCDRRRASWHTWPQSLSEGHIESDDFDQTDRDYHLYAQWLATDQIGALATKARLHGRGLYLDLPLGVNADSYDVWRHRESFAMGATAGAPPDPFFPKGQNWGFPPLHPGRILADGLQYVAAYVRHHAESAGVLRIDHMMGLHRLFWIPDGMEARDGVYVSYQSDALYAVYCLESQRSRTVLVGEDLGTVPPEVPRAMRKHKIERMYVVQYELRPGPDPLADVFPGSIAGLNTHDMPSFAAFWRGLDIADRLDLGILTADEAAAAEQERQTVRGSLVSLLSERGLLASDADERTVLEACYAFLAAARPETLLINLEDLWSETSPQNVPGTWLERPNWRRKAALSLEHMRDDQRVNAILGRIDGLASSGRRTDHRTPSGGLLGS